MGKLVFGEDRTCYLCRGKGIRRGQTCALCDGRGLIKDKSPDPYPRRARNTRVTDGGDHGGGTA